MKDDSRGQEIPEAIEFRFEEKPELSMLEMTYLINSILDFYAEESDGEGEEWKRKTGISHKSVPDNIKSEVEKAFVAQLKKFQK